MKILVIQAGLYQARGAEKQVLNLINNLNISKQNASLLNFFYKKTEELKELFSNIKIITSPRLPYLKYLMTFYPPIIFFKNYSKILDKFDIINIHNFPASLVIRRSKKPVVWMCNEVPWKYAPSRKLRWFFTFIQKIYMKIDYKIIKEKVTKIVVLDEQRKADVKKYYGMDAQVIRSGADTQRYKPISKKYARKEVEKYSKIQLKRNVILFISGLYPPKRLLDFLKAISESKNKNDMTALIIGSGPDSRIVKEFSKTLNIVHLPDAPEWIMPYAYNSSDVFVFPAINQPWGLVPFEAMACRIPVIVSKDTGASEVLTHMKNSILVSPKNPSLICRWIDNLIKDKELRKKISLNGYNLVKEKITTRTYSEEMLKVFQQAKIDFEQLNLKNA